MVDAVFEHSLVFSYVYFAGPRINEPLTIDNESETGVLFSECTTSV